MEWQDDGIVLGVRQHGEHAAIVQLLTAEHGRSAGYMRGATSKTTKPLLQVGNHVTTFWQGRLAEQLGFFNLEMLTPFAARLLASPERMTALQAMSQLVVAVLPERQPYAELYRETLSLLDALCRSMDWPQHYVRWELTLLRELGFGLRLENCAVNGGDSHSLTHVSPKSGHAVGSDAATPYRDRLLPLPHFLGGRDELGEQEIRAGLALTGYFIFQNLFVPEQKPLPEPRRRLQNLFSASNVAGNSTSHVYA